MYLAISSAGALVDRHEGSDGEPLLYSPLSVEESPEALVELARKYPHHRIIPALDEVRKQQGVPMELLRVSDPEVVLDAVALGVLCPVQVATNGVTRTFLFSPKGGITKDERIVLDKARAILACVRFGEHYAPYRRIMYPKALLEKLRDKGRFGNPRPDFHEQYGLLVRKQIGRIDPDINRPGFYNFELIDTPENLHALSIAIDLLSIGQTTISRLAVDAADLFRVSGSYSSTLPTRTRMRKAASLPRAADREIINILSNLNRGVVY